MCFFLFCRSSQVCDRHGLRSAASQCGNREERCPPVDTVCTASTLFYCGGKVSRLRCACVCCPLRSITPHRLLLWPERRVPPPPPHTGLSVRGCGGSAGVVNQAAEVSDTASSQHQGSFAPLPAGIHSNVCNICVCCQYC